MVATLNLDDRTSIVAATSPPRVAANQLADWPGRWLGGLIGVLSCLAAALVLFLSAGPGDDGSPAFVDLSGLTIPLLGIPIAFALGRLAYPSIRSGGWRWALVVGVLIGLAAPPLGAIEILFGPFLLPVGSGSSDQVLMIALLPIALVFSYVAVIVTVPVGLVTALVIRALPAGLPERLRMPSPLSRLGIAHAIGALVLWGIAVQVWSLVLAG